MIRRPPISTRTDTLFPYTTLVRSASAEYAVGQAFAATLREIGIPGGAPVGVGPAVRAAFWMPAGAYDDGGTSNGCSRAGSGLRRVRRLRRVRWIRGIRGLRRVRAGRRR